LLGTVLLGISFGTLATLTYKFASQFIITEPRFFSSRWKPGVTLALVGFSVFHGIPALGLQPNLPGIIGAAHDFSARQNWWLLSVLCSSAAVLLFGVTSHLLRNLIYAPRVTAFLFSIAVISIPFITGVPEYSTLSLAPEALRVRFAWVTLSSTALFWLILSFVLIHFLRENYKASN
jgi:predicted cobalt transporter CbtA